MKTRTRLVTAGYYLWIALVLIPFALCTEPNSRWNVLPHAEPWKLIVLVAMGAIALALIHYPRLLLEEYLDMHHQREFEEVKRRVHFFTA